MDPSHYLGLCYPTSNGLGSPQPHATDHCFEQRRSFNQYLPGPASYHAATNYPPRVLPTQRAVLYNSVGTFPARCDWHQLSADPGSTGIIPVQPQRVYPDGAIQTIGSDPTSANSSGQRRPQAHQRPPSRTLVPQETYKPVQRHAEFGGPNVIRFVVDGEEGIRLSDASAGNWEGFEGRDDRSLFVGNRPQIIIRLHLSGCSPWCSKIPTTDFTAKRRPITRTRLAAEVAKRMRKFIAGEKLNGHDRGHPRCGWGDVSLENVFLARMVQVSTASWQPELLVERPSVVAQAASSSSNPIASVQSVDPAPRGYIHAFS